MENQQPDIGSLFGLLRRRIADVRKSGMVNARSNLLNYVTEDPCGPRLPSVFPILFRRKNAQMGFLRCRRRKLIIAEMSKPYVTRRMTAYCIRRAKKVDGELPRRPMIWMGAAYINKDASNNFTWAAPGVAHGAVIDDVNRGGEVGRWAVFHAFADWVGDYGGHRADFTHYQLLAIRGLSVDIDSFSPWFRKLCEQERAMFPGVTCELHMDNARVHLYSADYNPPKKTHTGASILEEALALMGEGVEIQELRDILIGSAKADLARYIKCVAGARAPVIFKIAREFGNISERTPPYHPEAHPIELIWSHLKGDYSRRYEGCRIVQFLGDFPGVFRSLNLSPMWNMLIIYPLECLGIRGRLLATTTWLCYCTGESSAHRVEL